MVMSYHNQGNGMLKHGCMLPNLAEICLHSSTIEHLIP